MDVTRRKFVARLLFSCSAVLVSVSPLLHPLRVLADWNVDAFNREVESEALALFFPQWTTPVASDAINIEIYDLVENGAVVPVQIRTTLPNVTSITITVEKNPNPLIANFNLSPACSGFVSTRIKMGESSMVVATVQSNGKFFTAGKYVEVTEGGC
jgi:sulfur-oxidizing protein SoxY